MQTTSAVVLGAGQAGLALSFLLGTAGVDHVVLDRGGPAQRWRSQSWESLRLLTPNWLSRLPGWEYTGPDPAGFMTAGEVAGHLAAYAAASRAPVVGGARVLSVRRTGDGYRVATTAGDWNARTVVVATGWCDRPYVPPVAAGLPRSVRQLTPATYRRPSALPDGGVLVVGASASGVQLADELAASGRPVLLAVGAHTRLPRRYRGLDILWWLDAMGVLDRPVPAGRPGPPSLQLAGRPDGRDVDLPTLAGRGVTLAGRLSRVDGSRLVFADDLLASTAAADDRLRRLLARIDAYALRTGLAGEIDPAAPVTGIRAAGPAEVDLRAAGIETVVWATGYRRAYPWLHVPVLDSAGEIRHARGATAAPGLYVLGMRGQSRRNSSFLDGVRHDAATVATRVLADLGATDRRGAAA
ncbi:MAG TPA: NAD(P)/FAD-dependent oxidoreductase [Mycobacteriales bacterium]